MCIFQFIATVDFFCMLSTVTESAAHDEIPVAVVKNLRQ